MKTLEVLKVFAMRLFPMVCVEWAPDAIYVTGADGTRHYFWVQFGPIVSNDGIKAWQLCLWRLSIAYGWV